VTQTADNAALGFTVTDARTYLAPETQTAKAPALEQITADGALNPAVTGIRTPLAPEAQTAKSQALGRGTADSASSPSADLSAADAASAAGQNVLPVKAADDASSHRDHSGGQTPTPAADKQAVQSSETSAPAATLLSGQAAPSPVQQVFDAIQSAAPASTDGQAAMAASDPSAPAGNEPLRTITIALQPDGLGTVSIQLSLKSSQLGVRVETSESSTAQLLRQHDSDLTGLLQSAGYTVGSITIQAASQAALADPQAQAGSGGQNAFNTSNSGGSGTGTGSAGTEGQAQRQPGSQNGQREAGYGRSETPNSDSSLYV
jgi:hypothetical protein